MSDQDQARLLLDVREAADLLGIGRSHLYSYVLRGDLPSIKLGRRRKISLEAIHEFISRQEEEASR